MTIRSREDGTARPWQEQALCAEVDPELFFPLDKDTSAARKARRLCAQCPVRAECQEAGLHEQHGIWGGLTPLGRRHLRRRAQAHDSAPADTR